MASVSPSLKSKSVLSVHPICKVLQATTTEMMSIQSAVKSILEQPALIYVDPLLMQDVQLLRSHAGQWYFNFSAVSLDAFSRIRGLGVILVNLTKNIEEMINNDNIDSCITEIEDLLKTFNYFVSALSEIKMTISQSSLNAQNDLFAFDFVDQQLQSKILGPKGELADLRAKEALSAASINEGLRQLSDRANELVVQNLAWEAVIAVSFALGQVELPAASGMITTKLVSGAKVALESISSAGKKVGVAKMEQINTEASANIQGYIESRGTLLKNIAELNADIAVLQVYVSAAKEFANGHTNLLFQLQQLMEALQAQAGMIHAIQFALRSDINQAKDMITKVTTSWKDIMSAADQLSNNYRNSFTLFRS